jgi:signal recognition particle receptor subunit beta
VSVIGIEHVILVAGPIGAGKSTAIGSISDIPVVTTESLGAVAMDYGQVRLTDGELVRLYGVPGHARFDSTWSTIEARAEGMVLLLDHAAHDPLADLDRFLDRFRALCRRHTVVIGITRTDVAAKLDIDAYYRRLHERHENIPIFEIDARDRTQVLVLVTTLADMVETHATYLGAD